MRAFRSKSNSARPALKTLSDPLTRTSPSNRALLPGSISAPNALIIVSVVDGADQLVAASGEQDCCAENAGVMMVAASTVNRRAHAATNRVTLIECQGVAV